MIGDYTDATIQGLVFDAAAPCNITAVNTTMAVFNVNNDADLATSTVGIVTTTNFQGTIRFFNTIVFAGPYLDFNINGGDIGVESAHSDGGAVLGTQVNGGVFHLINYSASSSGNPVYNIAFGANAGIVGDTNEIIGCYSYNGLSFGSLNPFDPEIIFQDYALSKYSTLDNSLPLVINLYPNGVGIFQFTKTP